MKKYFLFVMIAFIGMVLMSCENGSSGKLEGKWRIITITYTETTGSKQSESQTVNVEDLLNYWEFMEDGTYKLYTLVEKQFESGTWTRNGSRVDIKSNDDFGIKTVGTIKLLTAYKLVLQLTMIYGENYEYGLIEVFDCKRE